MSHYLGDAHVCDIFGPYNPVKACGFHLKTTKSEASELRQPASKLREYQCAIVISASFAGREKDGRIGESVDTFSVDSSRGDCMASNTARDFRAVLEPAGNGLGWIIARLPFDVETAWKKKIRLRVTVEINGELFRTSLFADSIRGGHFILVNKKMQTAAGATAGALVKFTVAPDLEHRQAELPSEFEQLLKRQRTLAKWFAEQSESMRREVGKWLVAVKSPEARQRRAEQMAERMMLAMEGEKVLPPVIEAAFRNNPMARQGWEALTVTQRRSHLLAVFYYQSPEARERRVSKLVADALRAARN
jgi:uncharacterized protein YdeI (YjbR/CyaY-like superfamily)